jgi:hypothetical protein
VEQSKVVAFPVKPKTMHRKYKNTDIELIFLPAKRKWKWKVTIINKMVYESGEDELASTDAKALRAAERFIDKTVRG